MNRGSAVGIATDYGLDDRGVGVQVPVRPRMFTSRYRPDLLWGPTNLLSYRYHGALSPGIKRLGLYIHSPLLLHGVLLNYLSTGQLYLLHRETVI
jgi:hypothetical protein